MFTTKINVEATELQVEVNGKALDSTVDTTEVKSVRFTELSWVGGGNVVVW